jgi:hypothetical protein
MELERKIELDQGHSMNGKSIFEEYNAKMNNLRNSKIPKAYKKN